MPHEIVMFASHYKFACRNLVILQRNIFEFERQLKGVSLNITKRWINYCDGEVNYATVDDWNNFVQEVFAQWWENQIKCNEQCVAGHYRDFPDNVLEKYSFEQFARRATEYQELIALSNQH